MKETCLLGTERRPLEIDQLPTEIKQKISDKGTEEQKLLDAITYMNFYKLHGTPLLKSKAEIKAEIITESQEALKGEGVVILKNILVQDYFLKNELLKRWLEIVDENNLLIPQNYILEVLEAGKGLRGKDKRSIINSIGNKGRHLLSIYPIKEYPSNKKTDVWEEGNADERKLYFKKLRQEKLDLSRSSFNDAWSSMNVREKRSYLALMNDTLGQDDLPMLQNIYEAEFENIAAKKVLTRECKIMICSMLCRLGHDKLLQEIKNGITPYLKAPSTNILKKLVGAGKSSLDLPKAPDDFWNGEKLNMLFGMEEKNGNIALFDYDPLYWLNVFIEYLPFNFWCQLLDQDTESTIKYFLEDKAFQTKVKSKKVSIFRQSLIQNAAYTKNKDLITILSKKLDGSDLEVLIHHMKQEDFENYIIRTKSFSKLHLYDSRFNAEEEKWSLSFSKTIISELVKMCNAGNIYPSQNFGSTISRYFHPEAISNLISGSKKIKVERTFHLWQDNVVTPIQNSLKIRNQLHQLKKDLKQKK